eukprot:scaffold21089_cov16-Tisochrysis_lutea.AAC.1
MDCCQTALKPVEVQEEASFGGPCKAVGAVLSSGIACGSTPDPAGTECLISSASALGIITSPPGAHKESRVVKRGKAGRGTDHGMLPYPKFSRLDEGCWRKGARVPSWSWSNI